MRRASSISPLMASVTGLFRPLGLTCVQAEALIALDELGPATLKQLSAHLIAESGHPSRLISRLVQDGLVSRGASETDGRAVTLSLTAHGQELAQQAREARQPLLTEWAERYGSRLAQTSGLLRSLRQELRQPSPKGS